MKKALLGLAALILAPVQAGAWGFFGPPTNGNATTPLTVYIGSTTGSLVSGTVLTSSGAVSIQLRPSDAYAIDVTSVATATTLLRVHKNGYVGILQGSPQRSLHVSSGTGVLIDGGPAVAFQIGAATMAVTNGRVGVGTASPQSSLDVSGGSLTVRGAGAAIIVEEGGAVAAVPFRIGTSTLAVTNGRVGIGTANPASKLHLSSGVITVDGTGAEFSCVDCIDTADIQDAQVTTSKLGDGSVTTPKLASDAVTEAKIITGAITTGKLADGAVTTPKLNQDSVTEPKILTGAVTTNKLGDGSVTTAKLGTDAVASGTILTGSVTTPKLASDAVTEAKVITGAITTSKLGDGSVTTSKLGANSVTAAQLTDGIVTTTRLGDGSVTTSKLGDGAVTAAKILDGAVGALDLADSAVTTDKLGSGSVTTAKLGADLAMPGAVSIDGTTFQVDSANNRVGIGTASPLTTLDVNGGMTGRGQATFTSSVTVNATTALAADFAGPVEVGALVSTGAVNITGNLTLDANATLRAGTTFYLDNGQITASVSSMTIVTSLSDPSGLTIRTSTTERAALNITGGGNNRGAALNFNKSDQTGLFLITTEAENVGAVGRLAIWDPDTSLVTFTANDSNSTHFRSNGGIGLWSRTKAQIDAMTPVVSGDSLLWCSNCSYVCISTGATLSGYGRVGAESTTGCGSGS